jgi:6-phosphogluconolactonase
MVTNTLPKPSRRAIVGGALALGVLPSRLPAAPSASLIAGTYAREGGAGVVPLTASGNGWTAGEGIGAIRDASFGVASARHGLRYLLDEQRQGGVGTYDHAFKRLAGGTTLGADPCHAALSPDQTLLAIANYSSGNVALLRLDPATGLPQGEPLLVRHEGSGPNKERQAGPHAHWVGFAAEGRMLHSVDLGADAIFTHRIDPKTRAPGETSIAYRAVAGSGPRHLARHPHLPVAYLVAELANTVTILHAGANGTFTAHGAVSTLPANAGGTSAAAHIALNRAGTRLYVSNRGHDSIAVFAVRADGTLEPVQHIASGGHWPRFFLLLEDRGEMLVANERSGDVAILRIEQDGRLRATQSSVKVPGVVFLAA